MEYTSLVPEVARRSRELAPGHSLDPPDEFPGLFSCDLVAANGTKVAATGCVFRSGEVMVMPDDALATRPLLFASMRSVDRSAVITGIIWEWHVTRRDPRYLGTMRTGA